MASADELLNAAFSQHQAGNLPLAETLYRELLAQVPTSADAWHLLGALCVQAQRPAEAVTAIEQAIHLNPHSGDYYSHLGAAYGALKQHEPAIANLRHAVRLMPDSSAAHYNLGTALRNADRVEDAVASFRLAIAADPSAAEAHYNLANALRDLKRLDEAEASYRAALACRPNYLKAMLNLGGVLNEVRRRDEAIQLLRQAVALAPQHARAHLNLGSVLRDAGHVDESIAELEQAIALDPLQAEAHNNLGTAYQARAQADKARECYRRALELDPELASAHFSWATQLLLDGQLAEGFAEYEWRWKCTGFTPRSKDKPRWKGETLAGRTILLHAEQGLGDTLQFVRYAAFVKEQGGTTIVEAQPALQQLLQSCDGIDQWLPMGQPLPEFDVYCPLMSLPGVLKLGIDQLWRAPYLAAQPQRIARWQSRLSELSGFRVGLCWQGNPEHAFDRQRSLPLARLAPLAEIAGVQFVSLQKGFGSEQLAGCGFAVHSLGDELDADAPFLDTAAVLSQLDLFISVDTSLVHLAGALGTPVWIPLSAHGDWRWMTEREDSPWYPSARLFRQTALNQWDDVIQRMAGALRERARAS